MEDLYITNNGQAVCYISAGPKATSVLSGHMQVHGRSLEMAPILLQHVNGHFVGAGGILRNREHVQHQETQSCCGQECLPEGGEG